MVGTDWLTGRRNELAAERILDAAESFFARSAPGDVRVAEIAKVAGCSRATLYRYFENRDALYTAYVHRWANTLYGELTRRLADVTDPRQRLIEGMTQTLAVVRKNPALLSWFAKSSAPLGSDFADRSEVIATMMAAFLKTIDPGAGSGTDRRAGWLVRVLSSLLTFPGGTEDEERALLDDFVVPVVLPREVGRGGDVTPVASAAHSRSMERRRKAQA